MPRRDSDLVGVLEIGRTAIPYRIRRSKRATKKRIVVEPNSVEVVLPDEQSAALAHAFIRKKREWVFRQTGKLRRGEPRVVSYVSGSKVRYRGRWLTVEVAAGARAAGAVEVRSKFYVTLPRGVAKDERPSATRQLVSAWLRERLEVEGGQLTRRYAAALGLEAPRSRVVAMRRMWASCGKDGVVRLNPDLAELPRSIFEYVVAHEVAHLIHRHHGPAFWRVVGQLLPDWPDRQRWLEAYERDWAL